MTPLARLALKREAFADDLSALLIERVDHPAMLRSIFRRITIAIESWFERCFGIGADRARNENAISPNDLARMRATRDSRLPENVLAGLAVPLIGQVLCLRHARGVWTTNRGPASLHRCRFPTRRRSLTRGPRDTSHRDDLRFFRRQPRAAVKNHSSRSTFVGN